jgi:phosphate transport system protein
VAGGELGRQPIPEARAPEFEGQTAWLVDLIRSALATMSHATAALFGPDPPMVDSIGATYEALSTLHHEIEDHAAVLLATRARSTQAELSATLAAVHINAEAERMGRLAREVADIARTRRAWASIPAPLLGVLRELSEVCLDLAAKAADVVESHGAVAVAELDGSEDEVDRLRQLLYWKLLSPSGVIDVGGAIDLTLAARCYERFAEHAVAVAHRGALLAVGAPKS